MGELMGWAVLIIVASLPGLLVPQVMWALFGGLEFRTPERVEPSKRRYRAVRMGSATTLIVGVVILVAGMWPGSMDSKAVAAFTTALICCGLFVAAVIVSIVVRKVRENRRGRPDETDDDLPPNEPSDLSYGFEYFAIAFYLVLTLIVSGSFIGFEQRKQERLDELLGRNDRPLTEEQQEMIDEFSRKNNFLHLDRYPVFTEVPEGAVIAQPRIYRPIDATEREPRVLWYGSDTLYDMGPPMGIGDAELAISMYGFSCHVTGIILQQTDETVAIAFVVDGDDAVPAEGSNVAECMNGSPVLRVHHYLVDLGEPLGDRTVTTLDGGRMIQPISR